ncbi:MAG: hypothetical protein D6685_14935, partial [Bacteroidetes bacterium]
MLAALVAAGCDHITDPDGPRLIDRFGDFALLEPLAASRTAVDFAAGQDVVFTARFNKQVNWVVEIVGETSGALKRIEGFSSELTAENARWRGGTTQLPLFRQEPVEARLFVPEEASDTTRIRLDVLAPKVYEGQVVADFEGGDLISVGNFEFEFDDTAGITSDPPAAQGNGFYLMRGQDDVVANNFFVGLITIRPPGGGTFDVPTNIASELYLNCFLYGSGTPYTIAVVEVVVDGNGSGTYEDGQDLVVPLGGDVEFPNLGTIDFEGWTHYAEPASSFGAFGAGLTDEQTRQIVAVRVVLIS